MIYIYTNRSHSFSDAPVIQTFTANTAVTKCEIRNPFEPPPRCFVKSTTHLQDIHVFFPFLQVDTFCGTGYPLVIC